MKKTMYDNKSLKKKIILATIVLFSISLILIPSNVYAEEINVKSVGIDKTSIIILTNNSIEEVKTFKIWLSGNTNFESFKTEKGWIGEKNSQGVIIFTSSETIKIGESVKFGIKTDDVNPTINWKALDEEDQMLQTGFMKPSKLTNASENPTIQVNEDYKNTGTSIFSDSTFRVIPEKPNSDSTIRVTGDQFGASQKFEFYINSQKLGDFITDKDGHFITTMQIPKLQKQERVDFKIKSYDGIEREISLRLGENENRIPDTKIFKLTVEGIENIVYRGEILEISGKGVPNSAITAKIINPQDKVINTRVSEVDNAGNWKILENINIPFDAAFGKYSIVVNDGRNQIMKSWQIITNKTILIEPVKIMFDAGDLIKFNGTVLPNIPLELILEDALGDEIASDILDVNESGFVEFEYQTTENEDKEGTWTLIATQEKSREFIYVGYDEVPTIPVNLEFDKSNYQSTGEAVISFMGKPSDKLTMIILTPSGKILGQDIVIQLREDGKAEYKLELNGFVSGIYTAVIQKGNSQYSEKFSVGLQIGSGNIEAQTTQTEYQQGDKMLLLGNTNPNSLMQAELVNPNGKIIKSLEIASNNVGAFTEDRFRVPSNGIAGLWKINISSGSNLEVIEFNIFSTLIQGMSVTVTEKVKVGDLLKIDIVASHKTSISIEITDEMKNPIDKTLNCNTTKDFICETFWLIPKDMIIGKYFITVNDAISSDQVMFEVIPN